MGKGVAVGGIVLFWVFFLFFFYYFLLALLGVGFILFFS